MLIYKIITDIYVQILCIKTKSSLKLYVEYILNVGSIYGIVILLSDIIRNIKVGGFME